MYLESLSIRGIRDNKKDVILVYDQTGFFPSFLIYIQLACRNSFLGKKRDKDKYLSSSAFPILLRDEKPGNKGFYSQPL